MTTKTIQKLEAALEASYARREEAKAMRLEERVAAMKDALAQKVVITSSSRDTKRIITRVNMTFKGRKYTATRVADRDVTWKVTDGDGIFLGSCSNIWQCQYAIASGAI